MRAELVNAAAAARIDLDADAALAPAAPDTTAHRFSATADADVPVVAAVRELPNRLREGVRLRLTWRQTPAGPAPTPLPQPVLLVETAADGRPGEVLAYQVGAAMARSGVHVAVEVLTSGRPLTSYHAAALRDSTPLSGDAPPRPASPPERVESVVAEVVQQVTESHRNAPPEDAHDERPVDLFAVDEPAPRPVPMRAWQSGRRRRGFGEQAAEAEVDDDLPEADEHEPLPSPVPLARRTRPRPVGEVVEQSDPLLDRIPDEGTWTDEWASGDWALAEDAPPPGPGGLTTAGGSAPGPHSSTAVPHDGRARLHEATAGDTTAGPEGATTGPLSTTPGPTGRPPGPFAAPRDAAPATPSAGPRSTASVPQDTTARPTGAFAGPHNGTATPPAGFGVADEAHAAEQAHPDNAPVGSHALFTDQTPPAVPHSAAPVAAIPPSQPPTPDTAPPERPTGGGPGTPSPNPDRSAPSRPRRATDRSAPGHRLADGRGPPQAGGPRPAERRRPRAAHPAPDRARGRRRERQHRPQRRRTRVDRATGSEARGYRPGVTSAPVVPKPAATVVLIRDDPAPPPGRTALQVFLQRRVAGMAFAGGMTVFPGGSVDPSDHVDVPRWIGPDPMTWGERSATRPRSRPPSSKPLCARRTRSAACCWRATGP